MQTQVTPNPQLLMLCGLLLGSVANWRHTQSSVLFHNGDQILAVNDLSTENLVELQTYLKKLINDQVSVHVRLEKWVFLLNKSDLNTLMVL